MKDIASCGRTREDYAFIHTGLMGGWEGGRVCVCECEDVRV